MSGTTDASSEGRIRTLIVDDERAARRGIRRLLAEDAEIELIGECRDGRTAARRIQRERPDLVFLDVRMPEAGGFEALADLEDEEHPLVVFVTAHDIHALRAFEVHAVDYLLKPYSEARFRQAVERAKRRLRHERSDEFRRRVADLVRETGSAPQPGRPEPAEENGAEALRADAVRAGAPNAADDSAPPADEPAPSATTDGARRFLVRSAGRIQFVNAAEIAWIEAAGDYVRLHVGDDSYLMRATMQSMEETLEGAGFVRVHRSAIVRLREIRELRQGGEGEYTARLTDGSELPVSRSGRERLEAALGESL